MSDRNLNESVFLPSEIDWDLVASDAHLAQFYENDALVVQSAARFIAGNLVRGGSGVIIATPAHRCDIEELLLAAKLDLESARRRGRYVALDAAEMLARFTIDGRPDPTRFLDVVGEVVEDAAAKANHLGVRAFGEMVALLWAERRCEEAIQLE